MDFALLKTMVQADVDKTNNETANHSHGIRTSFTASSNPLDIIITNGKEHLTKF
jgi:hypothetical protein